MLHNPSLATFSHPPRAHWTRHPALFPWYNSVISAVLVIVLLTVFGKLMRWAVINAITLPAGPAECRLSAGACWAFVQDKASLLLFGLFPRESLWRPVLALLLPVSYACALCVLPKRKALIALGWLLMVGVVFALLSGGVAGLSPVRSDQWGGLTLTLLLTACSSLLALPLGVLLALARVSSCVHLRRTATAYVELMRSVPLLAVLFAAAVIVPLLLPAQTDVPKVVRALIGIALCMSAYVAEAIRSGLNTLPKGQYEAAHSMGLGYWKTQWLIILPQAFKAALPALTTTFLDFFKGTSLVLIIGVFDLMGASRAALADSQWQAFFLELYLAVGAIYFLLSFTFSAFSSRLERRLNTGAHH